MIKLLTFDNLFPPLRLLVVEWRPLSRFPAKVTLARVRVHVLLSIEEISSTNLKLSDVNSLLTSFPVASRDGLELTLI